MKGGNKEMFKIFKKAMSIDAKKKGGYDEAHEINQDKCHDTNKVDLAKKTS